MWTLAPINVQHAENLWIWKLIFRNEPSLHATYKEMRRPTLDPTVG